MLKVTEYHEKIPRDLITDSYSSINLLNCSTEHFLSGRSHNQSLLQAERLSSTRQNASTPANANYTVSTTMEDIITTLDKVICCQMAYELQFHFQTSKDMKCFKTFNTNNYRQIIVRVTFLYLSTLKSFTTVIYSTCFSESWHA